MLRVNPQQRSRLIEITQNLQDRIAEARMNGWHGEVQGLRVSLDAARSKLSSLERTIKSNHGGATDLGMPIIADPL